MKTILSLLLTVIICLNNYQLSAQNAPITTIDDNVGYSDTAVVALRVTGFSDISVCDLKLIYDPEITTVKSVSLGPGVLQTFFVSDFEVPGSILLSWFYFQGFTIPEDSIFISITFERITYGYSAIAFDNSLPNNCLWGDANSNELNDIPYSTYYIDGSVTFKMVDAPITVLPDIEDCPGSTSIDIPATVSAFNQIGAFTLTLQYEASVFSYESFTNDSGFPDLEVIENSPGTIIIEALSDATEGITLANNTVLFTVHFNNQGGSTGLSWLDIGTSCEYLGPAPAYEPRNDSPQSLFYINGSFTELPVPSPAGTIIGPPGETVCQGESGVIFSVPPIPYASDYEWVLPEGAAIDSGEGTPEISVSFSNNALSGNVSVYGINECGNGMASPPFPLTIEMAPSITTQPVSPDTVYAGNGIATFSVAATGSNLNYQWQEYTANWTDVADGGVYSGATTFSLTITDPPVSMNGNYYRCIVNGNCEPSATSDGNAMLTVVLNTGLNGQETPENNSLELESFPNPFTEQITFNYVAPSKGTVIIEIKNMYGEKVAVFTNQVEKKGIESLQLGDIQLKPGIYMATLTFDNQKGRIITNTLKIISDL